MIKPEVLDALVKAGATPEMLVAAIKADAAEDEARRAAKRANNAERQRRFRERQTKNRNANNALQGVSNGDDPPSPPKPPGPPNTPPLSPQGRGGGGARARFRMPSDWAPSDEEKAYARHFGLSEAEIDAGALTHRSFWTSLPDENLAAWKTADGWAACWQERVQHLVQRRPPVRTQLPLKEKHYADPARRDVDRPSVSAALDRRLAAYQARRAAGGEN